METVNIERMTYGIDGLGHLNGKVVFVPYTAPNDEVKINIVDEKSDYMRGEMTEIINPSLERKEPPCKNFPACGGCHWLHMNPETQRNEKETSLRFMLNPLQPKNVYPLEPLPMKHYRNKMELKVAIENDKVILGNYRYKSHEVVTIENCFVQCQENMALYKKLLKFMNLKGNRALSESVNTIVVRTLGEQQSCNFYLKTEPEESTLEALKKFFEDNLTISHLEAKTSEAKCLSLYRQHEMFDFMGRQWNISPESFFQNNLEGAEAILHTLVSIYEGYQHKGKFLDLYSGCGVQTFLLEHLFEDVFAVESNVSSYQDAIEHQKSKRGSRIKFICKRVEGIFGTPMTRGALAAIHLNPPRTGCSQRVIRGLSGIKPRMITYLSCNPMTFRRDAKALKQMGYKLDKVFSFDLFPGTFHLEILGHFIRGN
jgi:23S rRNA (uracil1939-C5)-methyltransferase